MESREEVIRQNLKSRLNDLTKMEPYKAILAKNSERSISLHQAVSNVLENLDALEVVHTEDANRFMLETTVLVLDMMDQNPEMTPDCLQTLESISESMLEQKTELQRAYQFLQTMLHYVNDETYSVDQQMVALQALDSLSGVLLRYAKTGDLERCHRELAFSMDTVIENDHTSLFLADIRSVDCPKMATRKLLARFIGEDEEAVYGWNDEDLIIASHMVRYGKEVDLQPRPSYPPRTQPRSYPEAKEMNKHITRLMDTFLARSKSYWDSMMWEVDLEDASKRQQFVQVLAQQKGKHLYQHLVYKALADSELSIKSSALSSIQKDELETHLKAVGMPYEIIESEGRYIVKVPIKVLNRLEHYVRKVTQDSPEVVEKTEKTEALENFRQARLEIAIDASDITGGVYGMSLDKAAQYMGHTQALGVQVGELGLSLITDAMVVMSLVLQSEATNPKPKELIEAGALVGATGVEIASQIAPAAFAKTPVGILFTAVKLITSDIQLLYDDAISEGLVEESQITAGIRCSYVLKAYQTVRSVLEATIERYAEDAEGNAEVITQLQRTLDRAYNASKALIREISDEPSTISTERQIVQTANHIDRMLKGVIVALGTAAAVMPPLHLPLGVPIAALAGSRETIVKQSKKAIGRRVQLVQGLQSDRTITVSKKRLGHRNFSAYQQMKRFRILQLQYQPPTMEAYSSWKHRTMEAFFQDIEENPEYVLTAPEFNLYQKLDRTSTTSEVEKQIENFEISAMKLLFHFESLQMPAFTKRHHLPTIANVDQLEALFNEWSDNLLKRMENRAMALLVEGESVPKALGQKQLMHIVMLKQVVQGAIDSYKEQMLQFEQGRAFDQGSNEGALKDTTYMKAYQKAFLDEIQELNDALDALEKTNEADGVSRVISNRETLANDLKSRYDQLSALCQKFAMSEENDAPSDISKEIIQTNTDIVIQIGALASRLQSFQPESQLDVKHQEALGELSIAPGLSHPLKENEIAFPIHRYTGTQNTFEFLERKENERLRDSILYLAKETGQELVRIYFLPRAPIAEESLPHTKQGSKDALAGISRAIKFMKNMILLTNDPELKLVFQNVPELVLDYKQQLALLNPDVNGKLNEYLVSDHDKQEITRIIDTLNVSLDDLDYMVEEKIRLYKDVDDNSHRQHNR